MPIDRTRAADTASRPDSVLRSIAGTWWLPLLRGLLLVLVGLLLMIEPLVTDAQRLVYLFAAFLVLDAVVAGILGLAARGQRTAVWWFVQGVVELVFAGLVLAWPGPTALVLYYLIASWAITLGVVQIITGSALLRSKNLLWPWLVSLGLVGVLFGMLLVARPQDAESALRLDVVALGLYAFVAGAVGVVSAFAVRSTAAEIDAALAGTSPVLEAIRARHAEHDARKAEAAEQAASQRAEKHAEREEHKAERKAEKAQAKTEKAAPPAPAPAPSAETERPQD